MIAWMLAVGMAWAVSVDGVRNPREVNSWVSDQAGVLPGDQEERLDQRIQRLHDDLGVEIAVVTIDDVDRGSPRQWGTKLFNHWGIGDAEKNTGLLVLLVMDQRRVEAITGVGLEGVLTDSWLSRMQRQSMVPDFKRGRYGDGVVSGLEVIDARLRERAAEVREGSRGRVAGQRARDHVDWQTPAMVLGGLGGTLTVGLLGIGALRRRERNKCPRCGTQMKRLSESEDDAHLSKAEVLEEDMGFVDHLVDQCPNCAYVRHTGTVELGSEDNRCKSCGHMTARVETQTIRTRTRAHGGETKVTARCAHCGDERTWTRRTPKLPPPPPPSTYSGGGYGGGGFSGGGGGSFGGGFSGGGGGGSSW